MCNDWANYGREGQFPLHGAKILKHLPQEYNWTETCYNDYEELGLCRISEPFQRGLNMKNFLLAAILAVTLLAPAIARADASEQGCKSSDGKAKGCDKDWKHWKEGKDQKDPVAAPEPGIAILVGSGLLALGGIALLRRKPAAN